MREVRRALIKVAARGTVDIALLSDGGAVEGTLHYAGALPEVGEMARWKQAGDGADGEAEWEQAELRPHPEVPGAMYIDTERGKYLLADSGDCCHVKGLETAASKAASFLDVFAASPAAQVLAVDNARAFGFIAPSFAGRDPDQPETLLEKARDAVGVAAKTVGLAFLGGAGARAGWQAAGRFLGPVEGEKRAADPEPDPAAAPQPAGESPAMVRPLDANIHALAEPAATPTAGFMEHGFGHLPGDPL